MLRNEFYNLMRKRKREAYEDTTSYLADKASDESDVLDLLIQNEERKQLYLAIRKLPVSMREILMESIYFQLKDDEIASLHQMSQENVRQIRSRAKKKLIEFMKEEHR